ncbi:GNAT family N-acetyltransferase [bacterium]|nr:GNAT family N-acetyltransferase [bacterium]
MKKLRLVQTNPKHKDWNAYLSLSATYFKENWPDLFPKNLEEIIKEYDTKLKKRLAEGGRGLFLLEESGKYVGIANIYLSNENGDVFAYIAEFYILPDKRRRSLGKIFFEILVKWGKQNEVTGIKLEVSKNKEVAISFWRSLGFEIAGESLDKFYYIKKYELIR